MIVVIQCAAGKPPHAGRVITTAGKSVVFVGDPSAAPGNPSYTYARPDDRSDTGKSWRDVLLEYNQNAPRNPLRLLPAYQLYDNPVYGRLVRRLGIANVFILSAGWGLIGADFLTPYYDITFSTQAERYKRRRHTDDYRDFRMFPDSTEDEIVFLGGKDYLALFCALTSGVRGRRTVFFNSSRRLSAPGCVLRRYETSTRTNWHYECANALLDGRVTIP